VSELVELRYPQLLAAALCFGLALANAARVGASTVVTFVADGRRPPLRLVDRVLVDAQVDVVQHDGVAEALRDAFDLDEAQTT